jgi:hypothetical protein
MQEGFSRKKGRAVDDAVRARQVDWVIIGGQQDSSAMTPSYRFARFVVSSTSFISPRSSTCFMSVSCFVTLGISSTVTPEGEDRLLLYVSPFLPPPLPRASARCGAASADPSAAAAAAAVVIVTFARSGVHCRRSCHGCRHRSSFSLVWVFHCRPNRHGCLG